jgi:hypothetical protein
MGEKMMKTTWGFLFAAFCLYVSMPQGRADICGSAPGNIVANCSFGTGDFTDWTLSGNDVPSEENNLYGVELGQDPDGNNPPGGSAYQAYFGDLDSNATTISQTFNTTVGGVYDVSWFLAQDTTPDPSHPEGQNEFIATFGAATLVSLSNVPVENYTEYSYAVTATAASSTLSFTLGNGLGYFLLDDIIVTPEPSSWVLMLVVAAGSVFLLKRKASRVVVTK